MVEALLLLELIRILHEILLRYLKKVSCKEAKWHRRKQKQRIKTNQSTQEDKVYHFQELFEE